MGSAGSQRLTSPYKNCRAKGRLSDYSLRPMATFSKISYKTVYKCRECGATSYQPVLGRAETGAMRPTGQYRCTGCRNVFDDLKSWWDGARGSRP